MSVRMRQFVELQVIEALLDSVFAIPGVKVAVADEGSFDQSEFHFSKSEVLKELFSCDEEQLLIKYKDGDKVVRGLVWLVYGNDGYDVISDYSTSMEEAMKEAQLVADYWDSDGPYVTLDQFKKSNTQQGT